MTKYEKINVVDLNEEHINSELEITGTITKIGVPKVIKSVLLFKCEDCGDILSKTIDEGDDLKSPVTCPSCHSEKLMLMEDKITQIVVQELYLEDKISLGVIKLVLNNEGSCINSDIKFKNVKVQGRYEYDSSCMGYLHVKNIELIGDN